MSPRLPARTTVRIALFIDGGYFDEVGKYYKFQHERASRLSVDGLLRFVRHQAGACEKVDPSLCHVIEAHYFRGRFSTDAAKLAGKLEDERRFVDVLIREGITQHFLPMDQAAGRPAEKGVDVWLSLEAFDLAVHKGFDVLALVACDGDYVPLARKLAGLGTKVMLLAWDFAYDYEQGGLARHRETRTSNRLIEASTYPIRMNPLIDDPARRGDPVIDGLFHVGAGDGEE